MFPFFTLKRMMSERRRGIRIVGTGPRMQRKKREARNKPGGILGLSDVPPHHLNRPGVKSRPGTCGSVWVVGLDVELVRADVGAEEPVAERTFQCNPRIC